MPILVVDVVRDIGASTSAPNLPCQTHGNGAISIAVYNIRDGRNRGLEGTTHALDLLGVYICVVQETNIKETKFSTK